MLALPKDSGGNICTLSAMGMHVVMGLFAHGPHKRFGLLLGPWVISSEHVGHMLHMICICHMTVIHLLQVTLYKLYFVT